MKKATQQPIRSQHLAPGVRHRCAAAVAACFMAGVVHALPTDPTVVNGSATFNQAGNTLTVTNSHGAIINWQQFSIGAGQTTHFQQSSSASTVLNRVLGGNVSAIYGTLSSNGQVWLVNPAGIMVGAGGVVDVARLVASTLNVTNADFLANRLNFGGNTTTPGTIEIEPGARISTPTGGSVYLVGANVTNEGLITTPKGETILAAGNTVQLVDTTTPGVRVEVSGSEGNATNLGEIAAEAGRIGIAGVIVKNSGVLNASSAVEEGGRIFLRASQDAYVDGNGRIVTTGTQGGSIDVLGQRVAVMDHALLDASAGATGGDGGTVRVGGDYQGKNPDVANARITYFGADATIRANGSQVGAGGTAIVWADDTTRAYGTIEAKGGSVSGDGGFVETSGKRYLDVNGIRGVDTSARNGMAGTWLLDPTQVQITNGFSTPPALYGAGVFSADTTYGTSYVSWATIESALASGNVVVHVVDGGDGFLNVAGSPNSSSLTLVRPFGNYTTTSVYSSPNKLSLLSAGTISISAAFGNAGTGAIDIMAGWNGNVAAPDVDAAFATGKSITANAMIATNGDLTMKAGDTILFTNSAGTSAGIDMNSGALTIVADNLTLNASAATGGGSTPDVRIVSRGTQLFDIGRSGGTNGKVQLTGNSVSTAYGGRASIQLVGTASDSATQTINLYYGADIALSSGSGAGTYGGNASTECTSVAANTADCAGSGNGAQIRSQHTGAMTIKAWNAGSAIALTGGAGGFGNDANIDSERGSLTITGDGSANYPTIAVYGGAGGGKAVLKSGGGFVTVDNSAGIGSEVELTIYGASVALNGGGIGAYGGAYLGAPTVKVTTTGTLAMTGGTSAAGAAIDPEVALPSSFVLMNPALIGWDKTSANITLNVGGALTMLGGGLGQTAGSPVVIGGLDGIQSTVNITADSVTMGALQFVSRVGTQGTGSINISTTGNMDLRNGLIGLGGGGNIALNSSGQLGNSSNGRLLGTNLTATAGANAAIQLQGVNRVGTVNLTSSGTGQITYTSKSDFKLATATTGSGAVTISTVSPGTPYYDASGSTYGGDIGVGVVTTTGAVSMTAYGGIYDENASNVVNITGGSVSLTSFGGRYNNLAISSDVATAGAVSAVVQAGTANSGGIRIASVGANNPASLTLTDNGTYDYARDNVSLHGDIYYYTPNAYTLGSGQSISSAYGGIYVESGGVMTVTGLNVLFPASSKVADRVFGVWGQTGLNIPSWGSPSGDAFLGTAGQATITGSVTASTGSVGIYSGTGTYVYGGADISTYQDIGLWSNGPIKVGIDPADNLSGGSVLIAGGASGGVGNVYMGSLNVSSSRLGAAPGARTQSTSGDITMYGSTIYAKGNNSASTYGNVRLFTGGDLTLNSGSLLKADYNVYLDLLGTDSIVALNEFAGLSASRIEANILGLANSTFIKFHGRSTGGIVIDGASARSGSLVVASGSGFYDFGSADPAGNHVFITYGVAAATVDAVTNALDDALEAVANDGTSTDGSLPGGSDGDIAGGEDVIRDGEASFGLDEEESEQQAANAQDEKEAEANKNKPVGNCAIGNA